MNAILSLQGRASRSEWWITTLFGGLLAQAAFVIAIIARHQDSGTNWMLFGGGILGGLVALWAMIAVTTRRFPDRGDSPWMTLILAFPVIGEIWVMIVCGVLPNPNQPKRILVVKNVKNGTGTEEAEQAAP